MDTPGLTIYNVPKMPPNWDRVGIFYVTFCATWTAIVMAGMIFCWYNRNLPIIRVRSLPLAFGSVICLHVYWILAQITYPIGATMPIVIAYDVQYFFMGTWFPLGIALFHAANLRFLRVAKLQKQFIHPDLQSSGAYRERRASSWLCSMRNTEYTTKVMTLIIGGVIIQALLTLTMWLVCRKYHPSFGVLGTEIRGTTISEQLIDLGRGWEWWPTVVWQFIWTWGVAPFLVWRAWGIRDTMGWRTQTIGACLSGLHATPMFLIASYVPAFYPVNACFHPSQWIHLNTMFVEVFTVFLPAYQIIRLWHTNQRVAYSREKREIHSQATAAHVLAHSDKSLSFELVEKDHIFGYVKETYGNHLLTMTAFDRFLEEHPNQLQEFSSYHDFSGENIAFLTRVSKWKSEWCRGFEMEQAHRVEMYNTALRIYIDFISPRDAEFPLNLSSQQLKKLEAIFEQSARAMCGEARFNLALPFTFDVPPLRHSEEAGRMDATTAARHMGEISREFQPEVFDNVQIDIKDLVLTNTWPKFVMEMQTRRRRSVGSEDSGIVKDSDATIASRITWLIRSLV